MTVHIVAPEDGALDELVVREVDLSPPGPTEVRISVRAVGVNPTDWKSIRAAQPRGSVARIGYEASGVVTEVGEAVTAGTISVDDEVIVYPVPGAYASDLLVPAADVLPKPTVLSFPQAANLLLVGTTAAEMVHVVEPRAGETVLVHGASGATGVSLLQQLADLGVAVIGTAGEPNFDLIRSFGAQPIRYGPRLLERLRTVAPGGVDVAFDCVGSPEAGETSLALVRDRSRIVSIADRDRARELGIRFIDGRDPHSLAYRNAQRRRLVDLAQAGRLTVPMADLIPLAEAGRALQIIRSQHPGGKLALIP